MNDWSIQESINDMVMISGGEFLMGLSVDDTASLIEWVQSHYPNHERPSASWFAREIPSHPVRLESFYIDRFLVTNAQYKE